MTMIETIIKEQYKVGGYVYDDKKLAEKLDALLTEHPGSKICPTCKGTQTETYLTTESYSDGNGYYGGMNAVQRQRRCTTCKTGILVKKVTEAWE